MIGSATARSQVGYRRQVPAPGVECADTTWSERDQPDGPQRQAIGAGFGRMESLLGQVVVDRREGVEREDRPARQIQGQPDVELALQQDENGPEAEQGHA